MKLFTQGRRRVASTLFPGNYFVYRNLALQVPDNGLQTAPLPFSLTSKIISELIPWLQAKARNEAEWSQFRAINEDTIELVEPVGVLGNVKPTSWWCTNGRCNKFFYENIAQVGIRFGKCPQCNERSIVQFPSVFVCPTCHAIEPVKNVKCNECRDSRSVILTGSVGRRSEYRWRCTRHNNFELRVDRFCQRDQQRMILKSVGGRIYHAENWSQINAIAGMRNTERRGVLTFSPSRATVVNVTVARTPIANPNAYFRGLEQSSKEPFINPNTGSYIGIVSRIETDAIIVTGDGQLLNDKVTLHTLEHALLNAAPAVTGLVQEEFGSDLKIDEGQIVIYDNVQGGSGGSQLLVSRRLDRWLQVVRELAECHQVQCEDACRGCLFLPSRLCYQMNNDLNRNTILGLV